MDAFRLDDASLMGLSSGLMNSAYDLGWKEVVTVGHVVDKDATANLRARQADNSARLSHMEKPLTEVLVRACPSMLEIF